MKMKLLMTLLLVTSIFFNSNAERNTSMLSITGDNTTCVGEVYTYSVVYDPAVYYEWTITNGTFITSPIGSHTVDVSWYASGSITVSTYSDPGLTNFIASDNMVVTVDVLDPYITMDPVVGCLEDSASHNGENFNPQEEEDDCFKACEDNVIEYFANGNAGSTFQWVVVGDGTPNTLVGPVIEVTWNSVGFGVVKLIETSVNGCVEENEICVEVIAKPQALFNVNPGLTVCVGQTIYFEDLSQAIGDSDLTAWEWKVSDGTFQAYTESTDFSHIFTSGGPHVVLLRVYNNCGCYDDYSVNIEVIEEPGPEIFCPKVVCPNEKMEIYTNSPCGNLFWTVDNGMIMSGQGTPTITVMWDDEPSGVGYVSLLADCGACNIPTVLEIPIVGTSLDLEGPIQVCRGDQVTITAPLIPGTFYDWNVTPTPFGAVIVEEIHNQVIIEVNGTAPITVDVTYNNELAGCGKGCGGEASHTMIAVDPSDIFGPEDVCVGDSEAYWITGPATGSITIELPNGSTTTIANGANYTFTTSGLHIFTPTNAGCQGPPLLVNAHAAPPPVDFITGPTDVCPGIPYVYEAGNDVTGTNYSWTITGGTPATGVGNEIAVTWTTGTGLIEINRVNVQSPNCESPSIFLGVSPLTITPAYDIFTTAVCANQSYTYSLDYLDGEEYNWTITAEGQGSVITDPNSHTVDILWNDTSGPATITASVRKCNVWHDVILNVTIDPISSMSMSASSNLICQNEIVNFSATTGFANYAWSFDPAFTPPPGNVASFGQAFTVAGTFNVTLVATDLCGNIYTETEVITVLPEPPAVLSITLNTLECTNGVVTSGSAELVTTVIGGVAGHTFVWQRNSMPFGTGMPTETITDAGFYEVRVTNTTTNCWTDLSINVQCPPDPPCVMPLANTGTFDFTYDNFTCGEVTFNETSVSTAPGWTFLGGTFEHIGTNGFSAPGPTYTYSSFDDAGYYSVGYELCYRDLSLDTCCTTVGLSVPIPIIAEAEAGVFCDGNGDLMIQLDDFSGTLGNLAGYNYEWFIGINSVGSGTNLPSGTMTIPATGYAPGNHTVRLVVVVPVGSVPGMPSDYQCEFTTTLNIPLPANATFTHNAPVCEDLDVEFVAGLNSPNSIYDWSFGDGASLIQTVNTAARKYDGPQLGGYNVSLTVTNAAGCIDTYNANVNVVTNDFDSPAIDVVPSGPICKPNPATLTFNHLGTATATSFDWSDGATINPNVVFDAGGYSVTATDAFGCVAVSPLTAVDIRPAPNAFIFGETEYCWNADLPVRLFGYAGPGLNYTWRKKLNGGPWSFHSTADNVNDINVFPGGSPYMYELTVEDPATQCTTVTMVTVDIHTPPPPPTISETVANCTPYTVNLQANTAVSPAYFNWSNGTTGQSINVLHGGPYAVTLTDDNGCTSVGEIDVQGEPNFDFFPEGCYTFCKEDLPLLFPGPYGFFDYWELKRNGTPIQWGNGAITNLSIPAGGYYILEVELNGCTFVSGIMEVTIDDEKCKKPCQKECHVDLGNINYTHIQDCLYEFDVDVYLGPCTQIVDYQWLIDGVPVPGGAVMSHVFNAPGGTYYICVIVTAEDELGNMCKDKVCFKFEPTCKCECDVIADFSYDQYGCEFQFYNSSSSNQCTDIYQYVWTLSVGEDVFDYIYSPNFDYIFDYQEAVQVCLTVYGFDGTIKCKDIICKTIYPCTSPGGDGDDSGQRDIDLETASILVMPNPVSDRLQILSNGPIGKEWHIVVIDATGRVVSNNTVNVESSSLIMSTDGWKSGLYQISISDELGNIFNHKVIKVE